MNVMIILRCISDNLIIRFIPTVIHQYFQNIQQIDN